MSKNKRVPAKWIVLILSILLTIGAIPSSGFAAEVSQEDNTGADTFFSNTEVDSFEEASPDSFRQTENGLTEEVSAELPLEDEMDHLDEASGELPLEDEMDHLDEASGELPLEDEMDNPDEKPGELSLEDEADHPDEISEDLSMENTEIPADLFDEASENLPTDSSEGLEIPEDSFEKISEDMPTADEPEVPESDFSVEESQISSTSDVVTDSIEDIPDDLSSTGIIAEEVAETVTSEPVYGNETSSSAIAEEGKCGANLKWTLDNDGTLVISGKGEMHAWSMNYGGEEFVFHQKFTLNKVRKVIIEDGVTSISDSTFYGCTYLTSVSIPESVTDIGAYAFYGCNSLKEMVIPDSVKAIGRFTFARCSSLERVIISNSVTVIDKDLFENCSSLTEVVIPDSVTHIGERSFAGCSSLANVTISNQVTSISWHAFRGCSSLREITIPASVQSIDNFAFYQCNNLENINVHEDNRYFYSEEGVLFDRRGSTLKCFPGGKSGSYSMPQGILNIGYGAFFNCAKLTDLTLSECITSIDDNTFEGCSSLVEVTIPGSVQNISPLAFSGCPNLSSIILGADNAAYTFKDGSLFSSDQTSLVRHFSTSGDSYSIPEGVRSIGKAAFQGCDSLKEIVIPDTVTNIADQAFEGCSSLTKVVLPGSIETMGNKVFGRCSGLESAMIEEGVVEIGGAAFSECSSLREVTIPDSVRNLGGGTFAGCSSLTEVIIPPGVEIIGGGTFHECSNLTRVQIPDSVRVIEDGAFRGCEKLKDISIPAGVTAIGREAFFMCRSLQEVFIPDGVTSIEYDTFRGCESLTKAVIPDSVTHLGESAFHGCKNLTSLKLSAGLTAIPMFAFDYCESLTEVTIPDGVTRVDELAFGGCTSLTKVILPAEITCFESFAFGSSLKDVYYAGSIRSWHSIDFREYNDGLLNATLHCAIKQDIADTEISNILHKTYNGKAITQSPEVKLDSILLENNKDYTVSYKNNVNAGKAQITFIGRNNYFGKKTVAFEIQKASQRLTAKAKAASIVAGRTTTISTSGQKGDVIYRSSDTGVASVNNDGEVTARKAGRVKITVTSGETKNYKKASTAVTFSVLPSATAKISGENLVSGIKITWKRVPGANGYLVYRGSTKIAVIRSESKLTYTDKKANSNGARYTYKIVTTAATGNGASRTLAVYRLARPTITSAVNNSAGRMVIKWGKNQKASGYQIQYSTSKTFDSGNKTAGTTDAATVSKVIGKLTKGKTYYVRLRSYKTVGNVKHWSAWSAMKSVKIAK